MTKRNKTHRKSYRKKTLRKRNKNIETRRKRHHRRKKNLILQRNNNKIITYDVSPILENKYIGQQVIGLRTYLK